MAPPTDTRPGDRGHDDAVDALGASLDAVVALLDGDTRTKLPDPTPGTPLATLTDAFGLDAFERAILLLGAARELVPSVEARCAQLNGRDDERWMTFRMALATLPEPSWHALRPTATLRRNHLIRLGSGDVLTERPVFLDERVLHHLLGSSYVDPRVERRVRWIAANDVPASHRTVAEAVGAEYGRRPVHLWTEHTGSGAAVAAAGVASTGRALAALSVRALPTDPSELDELARVLVRESRLGRFALLVDLDEPGAPPGTVAALIEQLGADCVTTGVDARAGEELERFRVRRAPFAERLEHWSAALAELPPVDDLDALVARFALGGAELTAAVAEVRNAHRADHGVDVRSLLWNAARAQAHPRLEDLAQRVDTRRTWDDLVLPDGQVRALRTLLGHARQKAVVDHRWGFTPDGAPGGGSAALFAGPSGTGKTLAAEVLAGELDLDLFRIDLSAVVSKFIGETEKNLRRVFDAAESGGAVLLFDEADALFGKRTEVKDSHDRHANIEVSYLLQRMESYGGLALLTTNHRKHLDEAFLRRIPFVVEFPFPTEHDRRAIWARIFPDETPVDGLDVDLLAQLTLAGGNIRTIARNAAALAADAGEPVGMDAIRRAVELEYTKMGRPLTPTELRGWA